jgi:hypothetical protein
LRDLRARLGSQESLSHRSEDRRMPELNVPIRCRGALVKIVVRPRHGRRTVIQTRPLPAYLDTGASCSMLDTDVGRPLGTDPVHEAALHVLGRADVHHHELFEVEIALVHPQVPLDWRPLTVLAGPVFETGATAALGRDFLARFVLTYDGPGERATLRW